MTRTLFVVLLAASTTSAQVTSTPRFDIIIRGGTIIDGTGLPPVRADVGVIGKSIARVGDLRGSEAPIVIDATDLYVTPGFINIHSHASPAALSTAENMLTQGVTLERFKDPALRAKIVAEAEEAMAARFGGPQGVYMPSTKRELTDVMNELGVSGGEALVRVLEQDNAGAILRFGIEDDLIKILQHPTTSIACDCGAALPGRATHPRYYGTFPRVLGRYVRDIKALLWPDAIRKMTLLPAATIGMVDRGAIAAGMAADITVLDPTTVIDHATFEEPTLPSSGIRHVLVNGTLALRDGKVTGVRGGHAIYRTKHMPSRAMNNFLGSQVALTGPFPMIISQGAGQRAAMGMFRFTDPQTHVTVEALSTALGVLQATSDWASFTARARIMPADEERTVVVIVDGKDPWLPDRRHCRR